MLNVIKKILRRKFWPQMNVESVESIPILPGRFKKTCYYQEIYANSLVIMRMCSCMYWLLLVAVVGIGYNTSLGDNREH